MFTQSGAPGRVISGAPGRVIGWIRRFVPRMVLI